MKICYHGTTKENAESILKNGFNAWTYFATHLEDAIGMGGDYVFSVAFDEDPALWHGEDKGDWQFMIRENMPPEQIVTLKHYQHEILLNNEELREKVFQANLAEVKNLD